MQFLKVLVLTLHRWISEHVIDDVRLLVKQLINLLLKVRLENTLFIIEEVIQPVLHDV